ncbi:MAG: GntR family transcriptional regulator [Treponema sp.]|jgi:DNA-binding GntR family transcriptional regulator|nr:GntR family transcriptional regulator [Treponema sp.]
MDKSKPARLNGENAGSSAFASSGKKGKPEPGKPAGLKEKVILTDNDIYYLLNNKNSLTKTVYERLISMFINNELIPGQMLNRRKLAGDMGVSVAPVLEALVQLELDGFIESVPRKGTIVRPVREQDVYERFLLREAFECTAARLYAGLPIRWHKEELLAYAAKIDKDDFNSIPQVKDEIIFHASLVNLAGLPSLTREYIRATRMGMFCLINQVSFQKGIVQKKHVDFIEKLTTDNPDEAEKIVREHIWSGKPVLPQYHLVADLTRG